MSRACRTCAAQVRALCGVLRVDRFCRTFARSPREVFSWAGCQMPQEQCPGENGQQAKHTFTHRAVSPAHNGYWMHHFAPLFASPVTYASAEDRNQVTPMATMCSATRPLMLSNQKRSICACRIGLPNSFFTHESICGQLGVDGARMARLSVCAVALLPLVCLCVAPLDVHVCISQRVRTWRALAPTFCDGVGLPPAAVISAFATQLAQAHRFGRRLVS